jgi:CheY-like chemotaxis protein
MSYTPSIGNLGENCVMMLRLAHCLLLVIKVVYFSVRFMPSIVVMEDEDGTRMLLVSLLKKQGYQVMAAENGAEGLELVLEHRPDLVISDVQMPEINGLQMVAMVRKHPVVGTTPIILLTSLQERAIMRAGMNTGADDFITKPFKPAEVYEAVAAQLNKRQVLTSLQKQANEEAIKQALEGQKHYLSGLYEKRLAKELSERWSDSLDNEDQIIDRASVVFVTTANFDDFAVKLDGKELGACVRKFYEGSTDILHVFGANTMQVIGAGLVAVFVDNPHSPTSNHGLCAVRAANGLLDSARGLRPYLQQTYPDRGMPEVDVHIAVHTGPVTLTSLVDPLHGAVAQMVPVGPTVNQCQQLLKDTTRLGWVAGVSDSTVHEVGGVLKLGRRAPLVLSGQPAAGDQTSGMAELLGLAA